MKKIFLALVLCLSLFVNTGCSFVLIGMLTRVSDKVTDPQKYGDFHRTVEIPDYYPESLSAYTVNDYCYFIEKNSRLCYEVFIDITLSENEFSEMLSSVNADSRKKSVKDAFHSPGYKDVIFYDEYEFSDETSFDAVESAHIEKVIYSEAESRIIFVLLYIEQYSYYEVEKIEFFKKLKIDPSQYSIKNNNAICRFLPRLVI